MQHVRVITGALFTDAVDCKYLIASMMNEIVWSVGGMIVTWEKTEIFAKKPVSVPLYSPKLSHALPLGLNPGLRSKPWCDQDAATCGWGV